MTNTIKIGLVALSAALFAGAAQAQEIRISLVGKSPAAITAEIERAAETVCAQANVDELRDPVGIQQRCVGDTIEKARGDYSRMIVTTRIAMIQPRGDH